MLFTKTCLSHLSIVEESATAHLHPETRKSSCSDGREGRAALTNIAGTSSTSFLLEEVPELRKNLGQAKFLESERY
jgi:hypothetical protein